MSFICKNCGRMTDRLAHDFHPYVSCCPEREPYDTDRKIGKVIIDNWQMFRENRKLKKEIKELKKEIENANN